MKNTFQRMISCALQLDMPNHTLSKQASYMCLIQLSALAHCWIEFIHVFKSKQSTTVKTKAPLFDASRNKICRNLWYHMQNHGSKTEREDITIFDKNGSIAKVGKGKCIIGQSNLERLQDREFLR